MKTVKKTKKALIILVTLFFIASFLMLSAGADDITQPSVLDIDYLQLVMATAGQTIADYATQYDGFRYVYGSASPKSGFDCSGLVYYVYSQFSYTLPRSSRAQYSEGLTVKKQDLQPGDLVFFATRGRSVSHVGIYIGDSRFIHASTPRHGVMISSMDSSYWVRTLVGAKRIITPQSALALLRPQTAPTLLYPPSI